MKSKLSSLLALSAIAAASAMVSAPAYAQAVFSAAAAGDTCDPQKISNTPTYTTATAFGQVVCTNNGVTATMQAWGFFKSTTAASNTLTGLAANAAIATGAVQGNLGDFGANGFGAYTGSNEAAANNGEHAFDNIGTTCSGATDASNYAGATTLGGGSAAVAASTSASGCGGAVETLLLQFSTAVSLSQLKTGYTGADADASLYVWTGGAGGPNMASQTLNNNASTGLAGWTLVGSNDFGGGADGGTNPWNTGNSLYSSYFLVATYFGATAGSQDYGNDQFKISGFTANTCSGTLSGGAGTGQSCTPSKTPEPASLALVGLSVLGLGAARRRAAGARR